MGKRFSNPTEICWSSWQQISDLLPPPPIKVLIVVGKSSQDRAECLRDQVLADYDAEILSNVPADPTVETIQEALDAVRKRTPDWVIAMGGGSVLDTAKAAALLANNPGHVRDYLHGNSRIDDPGIPVIAVPTTAGSGSEVTPYASITDSQEQKKISLTHDFLYPKYALLDPSLLLSLPPRQTSISGFDALSHAIEGYWSNNSTSVTDSYALAGAKLILDSLSAAFQSPNDLAAGRSLMEGSMLAGLTISNAQTTAVHATSYPMTVFFDVPHGLGCAMLLPQFVRYNAGALEGDKEKELLDRLGSTSMMELADQLDRLRQDLELPNRLSDVGIRKTDIATIANNSFRPDRVGNNPRQVTLAELTCLLEEIF